MEWERDKADVSSTFTREGAQGFVTWQGEDVQGRSSRISGEEVTMGEQKGERESGNLIIYSRSHLETPPITQNLSCVPKETQTDRLSQTKAFVISSCAEMDSSYP